MPSKEIFQVSDRNFMVNCSTPHIIFCLNINTTCEKRKQQNFHKLYETKKTQQNSYSGMFFPSVTEASTFIDLKWSL